MGIMTSYGSYNSVRKPIIMDNMIIAFSNSLTSFIAGFAVWSVVGFLQATDSLAKSKTSSLGLAFIAYPTAIDEMPAANFWTILLGLTLYLLGIDSAFSMVEATATVVCDTYWGSQFPRTFVAFVLCTVGFLISILFCTNFGFFLFDVIDYYLSNGLLIIVGLLQCLGCGWGFDTEHTFNKSEKHANSLFALTVSYWSCLVCVALFFVSADNTAAGIIVFVCTLPLITMPISYYLLDGSFSEWYNEIFMCGVSRIGYSMTSLGRSDSKKRAGWEPLFVFYFGFCIKYICPAVLWFIFVFTVKKNLAEPYGGYSIGWQIVGVLVPLLGLLAFFFGLCMNVYEQPFDRTQFDENASGPETN
jgi:SNF family Na+-dependent transporter